MRRQRKNALHRSQECPGHWCWTAVPSVHVCAAVLKGGKTLHRSGVLAHVMAENSNTDTSWPFCGGNSQTSLIFASQSSAPFSSGWPVELTFSVNAMPAASRPQRWLLCLSASMSTQRGADLFLHFKLQPNQRWLLKVCIGWTAAAALLLRVSGPCKKDGCAYENCALRAAMLVSRASMAFPRQNQNRTGRELPQKPARERAVVRGNCSVDAFGKQRSCLILSTMLRPALVPD
jgi:hypothetical protein